MRALSISFCLIGSLFVLGCNNYSSPQGVVGSSYKAIQDNDFKAFRRTFTKEFQKNNDMHAVMETLRTELTAANPISMSEPILVNSQTKILPMCRFVTMPDNREVDTQRHYTVSILGTVSGGPTPIMEAEVSCQVNYRQVARRAIVSYCYEYNGEYCHISAIK